MSFDFDVAIAGSVPLIHDLDDVDPTLASIKTSRRRSEIRMMFNLNTHALIHGIRGRDSVLAPTMSNVVHSSVVCRQHLCPDLADSSRGAPARLFIICPPPAVLGSRLRAADWSTADRA